MFSWEPILWGDTARCQEMTLKTRITWSFHIDQNRKRAAQGFGVLGSLLNMTSLSEEWRPALQALNRPMMD